MDATRVAERFWSLMSTNDFGRLAEVLDEAVVVDWPLTRERIHGSANFIRVQQEYPAEGPWRFTVHRLFGEETRAVSDVSVTDGVAGARVISFFEVGNDRITAMIEYWPDEYEPPAGREHLVERYG